MAMIVECWVQLIGAWTIAKRLYESVITIWSSLIELPVDLMAGIAITNCL